MKKFLFFASLVILIIVSFHGCKSAEETGGNIHLQQGRYDRAIEQFKEAEAKYPGSIGPVSSLAVAYFMKKEYKEAAGYLDKAMKIDKEGAEEKIKGYEDLLNTKYLKWQIFYNGSVEYFKDDSKKAVELAKKSLDVTYPEKISQSYSLLAMMMLKEGKVEEAKNFYKKAIEADKNNVEPYMNLGRIYLTERGLDEALKCFNEVIKIDSTKIEVYELIGQVYLLDKKYAEAIKSLETALAITGQNPTSLYNLMVAYYQSKNYDAAIKKGKEILELENVKPSVLTSVYNLMAQIYESKEDYKNAVAVIKEAIDKGVNNCDSYSVIAHAYYKLGKVKESSSWSKKWEECDKNK